MPNSHCPNCPSVMDWASVEIKLARSPKSVRVMAWLCPNCFESVLEGEALMKIAEAEKNECP
jgi:hypothetical protein